MIARVQKQKKNLKIAINNDNDNDFFHKLKTMICFLTKEWYVFFGFKSKPIHKSTPEDYVQRSKNQKQKTKFIANAQTHTQKMNKLVRKIINFCLACKKWG